MFLSNASIRRPIAMSCLIIGLALLGLRAVNEMGLELLPKMEAPMITVTTIYPGASPEQIETDVAKRIEDQVVALDGLKHVNSTCMENVCLTFLEFHMGVDVDIAAMDVREKIDLIRGDFPDPVEDPVVEKFDVNAVPVVRLALTGDVPLDVLFDYADNTLKDHLTTLPGVAEARLIGGAKREVHVLLDRDRLAARGLSSMDVVQAVRQSVGVIPAGRVRDRGREYTVEFDGDFTRVEDFNRLEIVARDGRRIYLRDVGRAEMGTEELRQKATLDGQPAVAIEIVKKAEANAVDVVRSVRAAMRRLQAGLPGGMQLVWVQDDGRFIEASVDSAWVNILQGVLLTALILFLFLHNVRSTLVVSVTMPLTIVIGLFFMQFLGYTLNMSTLIAIGMSVGILVTNSIVVLEAVVSRLDAGLSPAEAARRGAADAWIPVLASAATNVVVLFPIAMIGGLVGPFLRPLVLTMLILTVVSLFISFTLTPMLCALLLQRESLAARGGRARWTTAWNRGLRWVVDRYRALLDFFEQRRWAATLAMLAVGALFLGSLSLGGRVGGSFFPEIDKGEITVRLEFPTSYAIAKTERRVDEIEARLADLPELKSRLVTIGKVQGIAGQASEGVYLAQIQLKFSERDERKISLPELLDLTRARLADVSDCRVGVFIPSVIGGINAPIQLYLSGSDLGKLDQLALGLKADLETRPGFLDLDTSVREAKPKLRIRPRRAVLADLHLPATSLGMALRANLEGITAGTYKQGDRNYDIVVQFAEEEGRDQVRAFLFPGLPGRPVLLNTLGHLEETAAPIQILRRDKRRVSQLTATLRPTLPLGLAVEQVTGLIRDGRMPAGYAYSFAGDVEFMSEAQSELGKAALTALVLVILTLAAVLESWRQPALILVTLPLGLIGMIVALFLFGKSFSVFVIMGAVMLIGIVVNNAILIMDQFNILVREGQSSHRAMIQAAADKFRPITMITVAAVLGMLPLALGRGIGAELRNGVGVGSAGGILVSGLLTMLVVPVLYALFTRRRKPGAAAGGPAVKLGLLLLGGLGLAAPRGVTQPAATNAPAATPAPVSTNLLTLAQAKRIALEGNPGLRAATARVKAATAVIRQTKAAYYPILGIRAGARHTQDVPAMLGGGDPIQQYTAMAQVRWLIFDGFSRRFTLLAAKYGNAASEAARREAQRLLVQAVADGYYAALLAAERARIAKQDEQFNEDLLRETEKRHAAGTASRSDVLNFRMRAMGARNARRVIELDYQNALTALSRLLGLQRANLNRPLDPNAATLDDPALPDAEEALTYAWAHRPDLEQLDQFVRAGRALAKSRKGAYWPTIGFVAGAGLNRIENSRVFPADEDTETYVGVEASWDLFTGGSRKAAVAQVRAEADALDWQRLDTRNQVAREVRDALNAFHTTRAALEDQRQIAAMAAEIRDIVRREYDSGLASLTRLNEVQTDAIRTAGNLVLARIEHARAYEAYLAATARNLESVPAPDGDR